MHTERTHRLSLVSNWIQKNERHLSALVFAGGFVGDLLTFTLLNVSIVNKLFIFYFVVAISFSFLGHALLNKGNSENSKVLRFLQVTSPLVVQFFIGGLLSGFLIFYAKSSALFFSWPFILLLLLIFLGNEVFRSYRTHLAFQTTLLYFSVYAYAIFAVPLVFHTISTKTFLIATLLSIGGLLIYSFILSMLGRERFKQVITNTFLYCTLTTVVIVLAYLSNLIPPIPLILKEAGVYQSVTKTTEGYLLTGEEKQAWYDLRTHTVHAGENGSLSVYSSVFAPGNFSVSIVHEWQFYDEKTKKWAKQADIAFALSGGREGGYRGYSTKSNLTPGKWRVLIKTPNGQTLGDVSFTVIDGASSSVGTVVR